MPAWKPSKAEALNGLRRHTLQSASFWGYITAFVGGGAIRAFPQLFDVAFAPRPDAYSCLACLAMIAGGMCVLISLGALTKPHDLDSLKAARFDFTPVFGVLGFALMAAIL